MPKKLLMCSPTHFRLTYSINPWMATANEVDVIHANKQWSTLKRALIAAGARVDVLEPIGDADEYPDLVFAANAAVIRGRRAYMANAYYDERKGERQHYERWLQSHGYETIFDDAATFEGAGDALWIGNNDDRLICGVGMRTDERVLPLIAEKLRDDERPFRTIAVRLIDQRFYHLDTCFCPVSVDCALWFPSAFDDESQRILRENISDLIEVSADEACRFACNAVVVDKTVVMNVDNPQTAALLDRRGYRTVFVNMSEFIKSGGSTMCCTLEI